MSERGIARALGLNEDLTEALCLAHDIGHPPFGHAGEDALKAAMAAHGGFDHNGHTLRTLARLECPYPLFDGVNLTWETLEGLAKHNGPVRHPGWAIADIDCEFPLDLASHASLEAQIAAVADDIAYDNHDIDDGLRAGLLDTDQLMAQPFVAANFRAVEARFPGAPRDRLLRELVRDQIGVMVNDVIAATRTRVAETGVASADEVRAAGRTLGGFSDDLARSERDLKRFMYANLYHHPSQLAAAAGAKEVIGRLFAAYADDPLETAKRFEAAGLSRLHMVDLDGARSGAPRSAAGLQAPPNGRSSINDHPSLPCATARGWSWPSFR